jgi:hypothetical protein
LQRSASCHPYQIHLYVAEIDEILPVSMLQGSTIRKVINLRFFDLPERKLHNLL